MAQLSDLLKAAREEKGVTLDEVEEAIHIRRRWLEALETNNLNDFPSPVIARGLIRNYARYLGLDPIEALTLYDGNGIVTVKGQRLTPDGIEFMNLSMAPRPFITWDLIIGVVLFLVVVGGAAYFVYELIQRTNMTAPSEVAPAIAGVDEDSALLLPTVTPLPTDTPTPVPPTDTPTPRVYDGVTVDLVAEQSSWVQIMVDDIKAYEGVLQNGETRSWTGNQRISVRAGNAGGVRVIVNGTDYGLMGVENEVKDQIWEKVEDPSVLTPQASATESLDPSPPTLTPTSEVPGLESAPPSEQ